MVRVTQVLVRVMLERVCEGGHLVALLDLPGEGVLKGESQEECMRHEVLEGVCAAVHASRYMGCVLRRLGKA